MEVGLDWNKDGQFQQVLKATTATQQQPSIYTAAKYGFKWIQFYSMRKLVEANTDEVMDGYESFTGLHLFMVAAMGSYYVLSGTYAMMRMRAEITSSTSINTNVGLMDVVKEQNKRRLK